MRFTFLCLVTSSFVILLTTVHAVFNKDVICIIDRGGYPVCEAFNTGHRSVDRLKNVPTYDPYIPRNNPIFYKCLEYECQPFPLNSITQVTDPKINLKSCYMSNKDFKCEAVRFNYMKNIDKLLFLTNSIPDKSFYLVDCLVYPDSIRICHRKSEKNSIAQLIDMGTIARPNEDNILAQDEFLCEETPQRQIFCDIMPYVPFVDGLHRKEDPVELREVLLKTGPFIVVMKYYCTASGSCGYGGRVIGARRAMKREFYEPPGGKMYRCYYANKQQVCKAILGRNLYNDRDWSVPWLVDRVRPSRDSTYS